MESRVDKNEHFRHFLLFAFNRDAKAKESALEIREVYDQEAMSLRTIKNWFKWFKDGNFDLADIIIPDIPVEFDEERLSQLIHEDQRQTSRKLAEIMESPAVP